MLQQGCVAQQHGLRFMVLAAAHITIRLIMAFSVRLTLLGAVVLTVLELPIAFVYDLFAGPQASPALRLSLVPVPMLFMALAGFVVSRWILRIRRVRGQLIASVMVGLLDPHLFALLSS